MSWKCHDTEVIILKTIFIYPGWWWVQIIALKEGTVIWVQVACIWPSAVTLRPAGLISSQVQLCRIWIIPCKAIAHSRPLQPQRMVKGVCTTAQMYRACSFAMPGCCPRGRNTGKAEQGEQCCSASDKCICSVQTHLDWALESLLFSLPCKGHGCPWAGWGTWPGTAIGSIAGEQPRDVTREGALGHVTATQWSQTHLQWTNHHHHHF